MSIIYFAVSAILNSVLLITLIIPLVIILITPLLIYRLLVLLLAKLFRPDLSSIVGARNCVFANDNLLHFPQSSILLYAYIQGNPRIETVQNRVLQAFFNGSKKHKFPVLMQTFAVFGGFMFSKLEKDFDIKNHVKEWKKGVKVNDQSDEFISDDDLYKIRKALLHEPYRKDCSPWEIILVRNYRGNLSSDSGALLITKFHHGLADGFSLIRMAISSSSKNPEVSTLVPQSLSKSLTFPQNALIWGNLLFTTIQAVFSQAPSVCENNVFHPTVNKLAGKRHPVTKAIPIKLMKEAAKQSGTAFTSIILASVTGGIRSYLLGKEKPVPDHVDVTIPLPWPGNGTKIRNNFTFAILTLPTGVPDITQRLNLVHQSFLKIKRSSAPALNYLSSYLVGSLPNKIMSSILRSTPSSILLSSIPGPSAEIDFFDETIDLPAFEGGYGQGEIGMGVTFMSYNGKISISVNPDEAIVPTKKDSEMLVDLIVKEINCLYNMHLV